MDWQGSALDRRNSNCPQCKAERGTPVQVRLQHDVRCLTLRCQVCGTEWSITTPTHPERQPS